MNNFLFNLFYSSTRSYKSKTKYIFMFFQIITNFHVLIIIDIIFNRETNTVKQVYFPLFYLSPVLYLEHFLTLHNDKCYTTANENLLTNSNDQISLILNFTFHSTHSHICKFDQYVIYIAVVIGAITIFLIAEIFLPSTKSKVFLNISKTINGFLTIVYIPLLHIVFYLITKSVVFNMEAIGEDIDIYSLIWFLLNVLVFGSAAVFNVFTLRGDCILNFLTQDNISNVSISFLSAIIINLRMVKMKYFFFSFFWICLYLRKCYLMLNEYKHGMFSSSEKRIDFTLYFLFLMLFIVKFISVVINTFSPFKGGDSASILSEIIEIVFAVVLFILFVLYVNIYHRKKLSPKKLVDILKNDNEWGNFESMFILFNEKFYDFFQFRLVCDQTIKDREYLLEVTKRKTEIVNWFKSNFINEIKPVEDESEPEFGSTTSESKETDSTNSINENSNLLSSFNKNIKIFKAPRRQSMTKTFQKSESAFYNMNNVKIENEFKMLFDILLQFIISIKKHINAKFWNVNQRTRLNEFLIFAKLICYVEYDDCTTRAEFYCKKYLQRKNTSSKFKILMRYLDIKFRNYAMINEENLVHTIKMIELSEKLLKLIALFKNVLEQFDLNGDTDQKRLEIIEKNNMDIGNCYKEITKSSQVNEAKYKINENSSYTKLKIAQTILFSPESPDKIIEETDIQVAENEFTKNNFFILLFQKDGIIIHKSPAKFLERSEYKGEDLQNQELNVILPKCFRRASYLNLKTNITKKGNFKFDVTEFVTTKGGFVLRVKMKYHVLPIIGEETLLFAEVDFSLKNVINCFIINNKNEIIEIGPGMHLFLGITPQMLPVSVSDIFDTSQPLQNKFMHSRHQNTIVLDSNKAVPFNTEAYFLIYNQLVKLVGAASEESKVRENLFKFMEKHKVKTTGNSVFNILLNIADPVKDKTALIPENYKVILFGFPSAHGTSINLDKLEMGDGINDESSFDQGTEPQMNFENKYTVNSSSSVSMSTTSFNLSNPALGGARDRAHKNKRNINIPEILETAYGIMVIIIVIVLLIILKLLSNDLVNMFKVLKDVRYLNSLYYNGAFHILNKIVFNDCKTANSVESSIIKADNGVDEFWTFYEKDFVNISKNFFEQYNVVSNELYKVLPTKFINEKVDIPVERIQNDGSKTEENFLNAINIPKINFYILSQKERYTQKIYFFDILKPYGEQFAKFSETEVTFYITLLNYQEILDKFVLASENIREKFDDQFSSYKLRLFLIFSFSIFINLLSFFLYAFNINMTKRKILFVSISFFEIQKKSMKYLNHKLVNIKKLIEVEEHPGNIITKMSKDIKKKKMDLKASNMNNNNSQNANSPTGGKSKDLSDKSPRRGAHMSMTSSISSLNPNAKKEKGHYLKIYSNVLFQITVSHFLFIIYGCIAIPLLVIMTNNILVIQKFTTEVSSIQKISINYFLTLQSYILLNKTTEVIESGYVDDYPSSFYESLKIIQNYMKSSTALNLIEDYLNSLSGDALCGNLYLNATSADMLIKICNALDILHSSWTNVLSHIIRTIRNIFYNFVNSPQSIDDITRYYHDEDMQKLNIICFCFVKQLMDYIKDTNGIIIYEREINSFVNSVIIMSVVLILLEVGNFIVITGKIVRKLKNTLENFKLIEKFFIS